MAKRRTKKNPEAQVGINQYGIDVMRLRASMDRSREKLGAFRKKAMSKYEQLVGRHYSDNGSKRRVPVNLLALYVSIFHRQLAGGRPQCLASTNVPDYKPYAADFEIRMNDRIEEMNLEYTVKAAVLQGLFTLAPVKCGWTMDGEGNGESFADCIDLDDWVHDMQSRKWYGIQYEGDRYSMNFSDFQDSPLFDNKKHLRPTDDTQNNEDGSPRAKTISGNDDNYEDRFEPIIDLWDLWIPSKRMVVTIPAEGGIEPLRVVEWNGPDHGPYHKLMYGDVPGQTMPLAPTCNLMDQHDLTNVLLSKLGNQAVRQKTIGIFSGADKSEQRINATKDGEWARVDNPQGVKEAKFGGPDTSTQATFLLIKDLFNWNAGNMEALAGLSPQSRTLGQDEMLKMSASQQLSEMYDRTTTFTQGLMQSIGEYEWNNPRQTTIYKKVPGYQSGVHILWSPETRQGSYRDYSVKMQPYSLMHTTPQMKLQAIMSVLADVCAPFANQLMAQGRMIDFDKVFAQISRLGNLPEVEDILTSVDEQSMMQMVGGDAGGMSPITQRNYNRTNTPSTSRSGKDNVMMRALIGQASQQSETDQLSR